MIGTRDRVPRDQRMFATGYFQRVRAVAAPDVHDQRVSTRGE